MLVAPSPDPPDSETVRWLPGGSTEPQGRSRPEWSCAEAAFHENLGSGISNARLITQRDDQAEQQTGDRAVTQTCHGNATSPKGGIDLGGSLPVVTDAAPPVEQSHLRPRGNRRTRRVPTSLADEPSAVERAAARLAARRLFYLFCIACSRSTEPSATPIPAARCPDCGGTRLLQVTA
jgi:DNA-directed RNA polymerase subunit RPC12/RpoP